METKRIKWGSLGLVLSVSFLIGVSDAQQQRGRGRGRGGSAMSSGGSGAIAVGNLTQRETETLIGMMDEEKLAHDVYVTLARTSGSAIFTTISGAESRHMNALRQLASRYGLNPPSAGNAVGQFMNPEFGRLYKQLVTTGSRSLLDAYRVGAKIEEMDIADLSEALAVATHSDVQRVLNNLQRGSRNHLRAFAGAIASLNATYTAEHLSQAEFDQIAASPNEPGGRGNAGGRSGGSRGAGNGIGGQQQSRGQGGGRGRGKGRAGR